MKLKWIASTCAGVIAFAMCGCTVLVDANRAQCKTDADCGARGGAFADSVCIDSFCEASPGWACLDKPTDFTPSGGPFRVTFLIRDTVSQKPKVGLSARLCRKLDVPCTEAVGTPGTVDDQGNVSFQVDAGFEGYARFEGADAHPTLYFFNPPVYRDLDLSVSVSAPAAIAGLAALTGTQQSPERGIVLLATVDCLGVPASGVSITSGMQDPGASVFYAQQGLPSVGAMATDEDGYGGVINAAVGTTTFSGSLAASGRKFGEVTLLVLPDKTSVSVLVPNGP